MTQPFAMNGPNALYASGGSSSYYSTYSGSTWYLNALPSGATLVKLQGEYAIAAVQVSNPNGNIIGSLYYSSNYGVNWTEAASNIEEIGTLALSSNGQYALASQANGNLVYYSSDYGKSYKSYNFQEQVNCTAFSGDSSNGLVGTVNNIYYSSTSSNFGNFSSPSPAWSSINSIASSSQYVLACYADGIAFSKDYGTTWSISFGGDFQNVTMSGANAVALLKNNDGSYTVYYSTYSGDDSWNSGATITGTVQVNSVSLSGENLLIGTWSGLYYSSNLGKSLYTSPTFVNVNTVGSQMSNNNALVYAVNSSSYIGPWYSENFGQPFNSTTDSWLSCQFSGTSSAQGTATVTSSASTSSKSVSNNLVTDTYTATATGTGTGPTYDKALEAAAKANLKKVVEVLCDTARKVSPGPIVSSALVTGTKAPGNNN